MNLYVLLAGAALQAVFLAVLFWFYQKTNPTANRLLAILLFIFGLSLFYAYLLTSGALKNVPHLTRTNDPIQLVTAPLIYVYIRSITHHQPIFPKWFVWTFIPFLLHIIWLIPFYHQPIVEKIAFQENFLKGNIPIDFKISFFIKMMYGFIFLGLSIRLLYQHLQNVQLLFSNIENKSLEWLRNLLVLFLLTFFISFLRPLLNYGTLSIEIQGISVALIIFYISFRHFNQKDIWEENTPIVEKIIHQEKNKYQHSGLSVTQGQAMAKRIKNFTEREQPFLDKNCNLSCFADQLDLKPHLVSEVLNKYLKQSFYNFMNEHKINYAQKLLLDEKKQQLTIAAIASESGFKSKTTFYKFFKTYTSMTPTEFRKRAKKNQ